MRQETDIHKDGASCHTHKGSTRQNSSDKHVLTDIHKAGALLAMIRQVERVDCPRRAWLPPRRPLRKAGGAPISIRALPARMVTAAHRALVVDVLRARV